MAMRIANQQQNGLAGGDFAVMSFRDW